MNQKQKTDASLRELRYNLGLWNFVTISMVALPILWAFLGCTFQVFMELDEFAMPFMAPITLICLPLAAISGWYVWQTKKQINRDLSRHPEGEVITNPTFIRVVGGEMK